MMNKKIFLNKNFTYDGKPRAFVKLKSLKTLWFNTGTLCNLKCSDCYIESSPKNKSLQYLELGDIKKFIDEIIKNKICTEIIGLTGGEPFMNPSIIKILKYILNLNFKVLVLSNGMRPIELKFSNLLSLPNLKNLKIRISMDHYQKNYHEKIRGKNTWERLIKNIIWLDNKGFKINIASKINAGQDEKNTRQEFQKLFKKINVKLNANNKEELVLFPVMNIKSTAKEITQECWSILDKNPDSIMCSNSRMVVKKKEDNKTKVLACTLITKDKDFELGKSLTSSKKKVFLNHPFCSQFCVLGNSSCS